MRNNVFFSTSVEEKILLIFFFLCIEEKQHQVIFFFPPLVLKYSNNNNEIFCIYISKKNPLLGMKRSRPVSSTLYRSLTFRIRTIPGTCDTNLKEDLTFLEEPSLGLTFSTNIVRLRLLLRLPLPSLSPLMYYSIARLLWISFLFYLQGICYFVFLFETLCY